MGIICSDKKTERVSDNNNTNNNKKIETEKPTNDGPDISISIPKKKSKIRNNNKSESNKKVVKLNDIETKNNSKSIKKELTEKEKKEREIKQSNLFKSHIPENKNEDFYIVCPDCQMLFPTIKEFKYDSNAKDFSVSYTCKCNSSKKLSKSMFINFINSNRPQELNANFNKDEKVKDLVEEVNKKSDFQNKEIVNTAIQNSLDINCAPPAIASINQSIKESKMIKSIYPNFKASKLVSIREEDEEKNNDKNQYEVIVSQAVEINDNKKSDDYDDNLDFKEYKCFKTINNFARLASLIQLESGYLASGSYNCKILIWDINQESNEIYEREIQEIGIPLCLLEFRPNILLAGTNFNYISIWDLNIQNRDAEFRFLGHDKWVNSIVKCNDEIFASCSNDGNIIIWDFDKRKIFKTIQAHTDCILTLIRLKNGDLCSGGADLITKVWNWKTGICLYYFEGYENWIRCLSQFDDQTFLVGSEKSISIWKNQQTIAYLSEHQKDVRDLCIIDENYFASASFDNTIKIWNMNTFTCEQTLKGHTSNVINVIKLKGSDDLASCSSDQTIKIWKKQI